MECWYSLWCFTNSLKQKTRVELTRDFVRWNVQDNSKIISLLKATAKTLYYILKIVLRLAINTSDRNYATVVTTGLCCLASTTPPFDRFFPWIILQMQHQQPQQHATTTSRNPVTIQPRTRPNLLSPSKHSSPVYVLLLIWQVSCDVMLAMLIVIVPLSNSDSTYTIKNIISSGSHRMWLWNQL